MTTRPPQASPSTSDIHREVTSFLPVAEITEQIRVALRRAFPRHLPGFAVCSQNRQAGALLQVRWSDGPIQADVERVVSALTEGSFVTHVYVRWTTVDVGHSESAVTGPERKQEPTRQLTTSSANDGADIPF
jgi:Large polyvalent protein associated domain 29